VVGGLGTRWPSSGPPPLSLVPKDFDRRRTRVAAGVVGALLTLAYVSAFGGRAK
jgi:hypothetical protein